MVLIIFQNTKKCLHITSPNGPPSSKDRLKCLNLAIDLIIQTAFFLTSYLILQQIRMKEYSKTFEGKDLKFSEPKNL